MTVCKVPMAVTIQVDSGEGSLERVRMRHIKCEIGGAESEFLISELVSLDSTLQRTAPPVAYAKGTYGSNYPGGLR
jgi:hypothetical protein